MAGLWPTVLTVRESGVPDRVMRGLRPRDSSEWERLRLVNREWLEPWEASSPNPVGAMRFRALVRHYDHEAQAGRLQPFVIEVGGRLVGQMHLFGITWGSLCSGSAGYWVSRSMAGQGIATLCLAALVDHALYGLGLHRVEVNIRPENVASLRVVEKLGFRDEGVRERYLHIGGGWRDHRTFALTAEDLSGGSLVGRWHAQGAPDLTGSPNPAPPPDAGR